MPESCCAVGCSQRRVKGCGIRFYRIPKGRKPFEAGRRRDWVKAINRDKWSEGQISHARVCGNHLLSDQC